MTDPIPSIKNKEKGTKNNKMLQKKRKTVPYSLFMMTVNIDITIMYYIYYLLTHYLFHLQFII